jgi:hypothetical protein
MLILHLTNGHRELSHCPAQCVEKSIKKGCKEFFVMNAGLPKQNLEKAPKTMIQHKIYPFDKVNALDSRSVGFPICNNTR